jgi:hypothetical protein
LDIVFIIGFLFFVSGKSRWEDGRQNLVVVRLVHVPPRWLVTGEADSGIANVAFPMHWDGALDEAIKKPAFMRH